MAGLKVGEGFHLDLTLHLLLIDHLEHTLKGDDIHGDAFRM